MSNQARSSTHTHTMPPKPQYTTLTRTELINELKKKKVEYPPSARKEALIELLTAAAQPIVVDDATPARRLTFQDPTDLTDTPDPFNRFTSAPRWRIRCSRSLPRIARFHPQLPDFDPLLDRPRPKGTLHTYNQALPTLPHLRQR